MNVHSLSNSPTTKFPDSTFWRFADYALLLYYDAVFTALDSGNFMNSKELALARPLALPVCRRPAGSLDFSTGPGSE
jgi:hypothetical protein